MVMLEQGGPIWSWSHMELVHMCIRNQHHLYPECSFMYPTCTIVHRLLSIMCSQFWKGHHSCPRVHGCTGFCRILATLY